MQVFLFETVFANEGMILHMIEYETQKSHTVSIEHDRVAFAVPIFVMNFPSCHHGSTLLSCDYHETRKHFAFQTRSLLANTDPVAPTSIELITATYEVAICVFRIKVAQEA